MPELVITSPPLLNSRMTCPTQPNPHNLPPDHVAEAVAPGGPYAGAQMPSECIRQKPSVSAEIRRNLPLALPAGRSLPPSSLPWLPGSQPSTPPRSSLKLKCRGLRGDSLAYHSLSLPHPGPQAPSPGSDGEWDAHLTAHTDPPGPGREARLTMENMCLFQDKP
ncbi:unnamed protein product [Boreogadus saida]